jgi:Ribonuclease G/E
MPNKMLIDATHPEETRVVVVRGNRVEEFDFETAQRKQLRGNIYLAKVTRVEPSLQAAFIEYGGNRHGFLAFSEIHPDYYQIPVADRQALIEADERAHREAEEESENRSNHRRRSRHRNARRRGHGDRVQSDVVENAAQDPSQAPQPYEDEPHGHDGVYAGEAQAHEAAHVDDAVRQEHEAHDHEAHGRDADQPHDHHEDQAAVSRETAAAAEAPAAEAVPESGTPAAAPAEEAVPRHALKTRPPKTRMMNITSTNIRPMPTSRRMSSMPAKATPRLSQTNSRPRRKATRATRMTTTRMARTPKRRSSNPSAATTFWRRFRNARSVRAASTRSRKSSSAAR